MFDEKQMLIELREEKIQLFLNHIEQYDRNISSKLIAQGYRYMNRVCRTVMFTFGEVTFYRNRWYKQNTCYVPVDDYLGLDKYSRYSQEFLYKVGKLSTYTSYRKVVDIVKETLGLHITKDTILKVCKTIGKICDEKDDYRFHSADVPKEKIKADTLYVEGDGLFVNTTNHTEQTHHTALTHFVVHEGNNTVSQNRKALVHKKNIISTKHLEAKRELVDYIYNTYHITDDTMLITNADNGVGYGVNFFKDIAKACRIKRHEHFIDAYHINQKIRMMYATYPQDLKKKLLASIYTANKQAFVAALDTTESLIEDAEELKVFQEFATKLKQIFRYIIPAHCRGLTDEHLSIGVMESQQRQISYRMKNRGMYWSVKGADTMAKMIISVSEGTLRDLFFGKWRQEYVKYTEYEDTAAELIHQKLYHDHKESIIRGKIRNDNIRKGINRE
ncbi:MULTISPECIES: ISLre2 family transposase [unclassified Granulicatella]|uniref:ISLre2 family transposase n=1 Tax=unclassified Granulicatella TaxID=2630493 RepID=UPI001430CE10|nr:MULTISPECIES: ISLre2 family transposase [unclassified Granulicatella]MBF0780079.1 ISLre2 family transposase [Granulicatella sp. 19428wC4_WM01]